MKKSYIKNIFVALVLAAPLAVTSCASLVEEPQYRPQVGEEASLSLSLNMPQISVATKSIATDPRNTNNTWSDWEKYADGSLLYNVTLFVVDSEGKLVGYRQIENGSSDINSMNGFHNGSAVDVTAVSGTAVQITFPQSDPLHGNIELLKGGNYTLIALANYAPVTVGDKSYAGLGKAAEDGSGNFNGNGDLNAIVQGILATFSSAQGLADFTPDNYQAFFKYRLNAGEDRVCKQNPQPLVMIKRVTLAEGNNNVQGELSRTFARVRLEINNRSDNTLLDISNLSFNGSYASKNAYLLNDVQAGTANFFSNFSLYDGNQNSDDNTRGKLGVNSADAIVQASSGTHRVLSGGTEAIFDAYILEGKIDASQNHSFSFRASYAATMEDGDATHNAMIASFFSNNKYNGSNYGGMWNAYYGIIDPAFYLFIRSRTSNVATCLMADAQTYKAVVANSTAGNEQSGTFKMPPEFIWEMVIPGGSNSVTKEGWSGYVEYVPGYLKSLSSGLYLQPYNGGTDKVPQLGTNPGNVIFKMDFGGEDEHGTVFCQYNGRYYYLNGSTCEWTGPVSNMNNYKMLTFETIIAEPVTPKVKDITSHIEVTNTTGGTVAKYEITRNEFYHGVIPINIGN